MRRTPIATHVELSVAGDRRVRLPNPKGDVGSTAGPSRPDSPSPSNLGMTSLFLATVTTLGILINTYRFGIWDHAVYVPVVERLAHPNLFRSDYLFRVPMGDYALWYPTVA